MRTKRGRNYTLNTAERFDKRKAAESKFLDSAERWLRGGDTPRGQRRLLCRLRCGSPKPGFSGCFFETEKWHSSIVGNPSNPGTKAAALIKELRTKQVPMVLSYRADHKWRKVFFDAIGMLATSDGRLKISAVRAATQGRGVPTEACNQAISRSISLWSHDSRRFSGQEQPSGAGCHLTTALCRHLQQGRRCTRTRRAPFGEARLFQLLYDRVDHRFRQRARQAQGRHARNLRPRSQMAEGLLRRDGIAGKIGRSVEDRTREAVKRAQRTTRVVADGAAQWTFSRQLPRKGSPR